MSNKRALAMAVGLVLVAATESQAQLNPAYNPGGTDAPGDLLINLRSTTSGTDPDIVLDLGTVSAFTSLSGTTIIDSGSWGTGAYLNSSQTTSLFTDLGGVPSGSNPIGISAMADNFPSAYGGDPEVWLTTTLASAPTSTPGNPSHLQGNSTAETQIANKIDNVGNGASGVGTPTASLTTINGFAVGDNNSDANSFQQEVQDTQYAQNGLMDFTGYLNSNVHFETPNTGSTVYEALWTVPSSGDASISYDGYLTFGGNGEITYTAAVPEPSTYGMLAGAGVAAWASLRRSRKGTK